MTGFLRKKKTRKVGKSRETEKGERPDNKKGLSSVWTCLLLSSKSGNVILHLHRIDTDITVCYISINFVRISL